MSGKYKLLLEQADKSLRNADYMAYMTFPIVRDYRILLSILEQTYKVIISIINAVLNYEYSKGFLIMSNNPQENFKKFQNFCAPLYGISDEQLDRIIDIFSLMKKHKNSSVEFVKDNSLIILSDNLKTNPLNIEKIKDFLFLAKEIMKLARARIH